MEVVQELGPDKRKVGELRIANINLCIPELIKAVSGRTVKELRQVIDGAGCLLVHGFRYAEQVMPKIILLTLLQDYLISLKKMR
jgi:hypothetical protein